MSELLPPIPGPTYTITVEVRGHFHCPTCDQTLPGSSMDHIDDGQYAFGHVHITTSYQALRHVRACTGKDQPMPSQTTLTAAEIETLQAQLLKMIDDLDAIERKFPVGSLWNAAGTARQAVSGLMQEVHNVAKGTAGNVVLAAD